MTGRRDAAAFHSPRGFSEPWEDQPAEVCRQLELLDDAMFAAIDGSADALAEACRLWDQAVGALDWHLVEESREQYLRYAIDVTRRYEYDPAGPERSLIALEVISILTKA